MGYVESPTNMFVVVNSARPFNGRVALVTAAGGAIGSSIAEQLGAAGAAVGVVAMSRARADATVERIRAAGARRRGSQPISLIPSRFLASSMASSGYSVKSTFL
jgi:NAD(P)-dependent dehydrogenase (short-subunit alcohol dehydrogenase family)